MAPEIRIEPARADDLPQLQTVERAANRLFAGHGLGVTDADVTSLAELSEAEAVGLLWVARAAGGAPIGFALVCFLDGLPHLEELDVDPAHGRRGVGRRLLEHVLAWAAAAGHPAVTLTTFRELPWNEPFYASAGFRALPEAERGPELAALIRDETARGLDAGRRVAMRRALALPAQPR